MFLFLLVHPTDTFEIFHGNLMEYVHDALASVRLVELTVRDVIQQAHAQK